MLIVSVEKTVNELRVTMAGLRFAVRPFGGETAADSVTLKLLPVENTLG